MATKVPRGPIDDLVDSIIARLSRACLQSVDGKSCLERKLKDKDACLLCESARIHRQTMDNLDRCIADNSRLEHENRGHVSFRIAANGGWG